VPEIFVGWVILPQDKKTLKQTEKILLVHFERKKPSPPPQYIPQPVNNVTSLSKLLTVNREL